MRTAGAIYPNVQNKHAAPGICTLSGDSLLRLFRATGEPFYLELLREIAHNLTQYISRPDRPVPVLHEGQWRDLPSGWMNERVNMSDWEGKENIGAVFYGSCWCEVAAMLTCAEVPGLYVRTDLGQYWTFDHVETTREDLDDSNMVLRIANPTRWDCTLRVAMDDATTISRPLVPFHRPEGPSVHVPANSEKKRN